MVTVSYHPSFEKQIRKIKNEGLKQRIKLQISKIIENPEIGKPMRFGRKGTRE
jgi:mRNA-degrading endonuclease RelE of RelBE toxin-antitoxin system